MRNTDPDPPPWKPLGEKVAKPAPAPASPVWKQVPGAAKGIEEGADGKLRTNLPLPKGQP